jgi:transcriptional regulator with XRE-family HTH domain
MSDQQRRRRGLFATPEGRELMKETIFFRGLTSEDVAANAEVSAKTLTKFLNGSKGIDEKKARSICAALDLEFLKVVSLYEEASSQAIKKLENFSDRDATNLIQGLEVGLTQRQEDGEAQSTAIKWLQLHRDQIIQTGEIENEILKINSGNQIHRQINHSEIARDLSVFIGFIESCLQLGDIRLIDDAIEESLIPDTYDTDIYVYFLEFIRDYKVSNKAPSGISRKILAILNYIIKILPMKM